VAELSITNKVIYNLVNGTMSTLASWIVLVLLVALFAFVSLAQTQRRRSSGLTAPPLSIVILKIVLAAVAGAVLVIVCNLNRGLLAPLRGVPWVVLYILAAVAVDSVVRRRGSSSV
jgi:D-xylose transport system permease protein